MPSARCRYSCALAPRVRSRPGPRHPSADTAASDVSREQPKSMLELPSAPSHSTKAKWDIIDRVLVRRPLKLIITAACARDRETFLPETARLRGNAGKAGLPVLGMFGYVWENNLDLTELHAELGPRFAIDMGVVMGGWNLAVGDPDAVRDVMNSKDDRFYAAWPGTPPHARTLVSLLACSSVPPCPAAVTVLLPATQE